MAAIVRSKKALFVAVLALGMVAVLEASSFLVLWVRDGALPTPARLRAERARAGAEAAPDELLPPEPGPTEEGQVIHPFVGFVQDPGLESRFWKTDAQGFPHVPKLLMVGTPPAEGPPFNVAVFGGSVANGFCFAGRHAFARALARSPQVAGRPIAIHCYAMGGYKQPQQLMALSWALSLGAKLDLAINLDGFNEIALPVAENARAGIYPFYPRWWSARVAGIQSGETLRLLGLAELYKERRRERSGLCASWPLAWSSTCHLAWTALDRRLAVRAYDTEQRLAALVPRRESFLTRGPASEPGEAAALYPRLVEHWARASRLMFDFCRARGIPYFHFLQPNQYLPGSKPMGREEQRIAIDPKQPYRKPVEEGYPLLIEAGRSLAASGVPFTDLTALFAGHPEPLYSDTCCHYNREGNRLLATAIGRAVLAALGGPQPPATPAP